ncbi:MAG: RDD family protein [Chloroflexi bacterium]|nr:RDD family protein [Chloroflexota bacterium]
MSKAGFWIRLIAIILDVFLIYWFVRCIEWCFHGVGIYIPRELTFCLVFAAYSIGLIIANGCTLGKAACGLVVQSVGIVGISFKQVILREIVCKPLSGLCLGLGFLWAGFSRNKRAWHDRTTKTAVFRTGVPCKWAQYIMFVICILAAISTGRKALWAKQIVTDIRAMALPADVNLPYLERDPRSLRDVWSLSQGERSHMKDWLDGQELRPVDYLVQTSAAHRVTIVGEVHGKKEYLDLLNEAISRLYHEAGVRCIALEVCLAKDNKLLHQLVTAPQFDRDLAM